MFELGSSLRQARVRRGIELAQVAAATQIRVRYLQALEDERFELIPGGVYAKGFLRAYADYLGLDSRLFVDEYNARFAAEEAEPAPGQLEVPPAPVRPYGVAIAAALVALTGGLLIWQLTGSSSRSPRGPRPSAAAEARASVTPPAATHHARPSARPVTATLVLRAARGPCWLSVRRESALGETLFEGTLEPGQWRRFTQGPLWIRIGAPWNLEATLGGVPLSLPQTVADVAVTSTEVHTLATQ